MASLPELSEDEKNELRRQAFDTVLTRYGQRAHIEQWLEEYERLVRLAQLRREADKEATTREDTESGATNTGA